MVPAETLRAYRAFLEYRLLSALERRAIAYWADATGILTRALLDLGRHQGFAVSVEKPYAGPGGEASSLRSDVHWQGATSHLWEIDRTVKNASAEKLAAAGEAEKYWVLWAQDNDLLSLRLLGIEGINVIVLGHDVRKLIWERLAFERDQRIAVQALLAREGRFAPARSLEAALAESVPPGEAPATEGAVTPEEAAAGPSDAQASPPAPPGERETPA